MMYVFVCKSVYNLKASNHLLQLENIGSCIDMQTHASRTSTWLWQHASLATLRPCRFS